MENLETEVRYSLTSVWGFVRPTVALSGQVRKPPDVLQHLQRFLFADYATQVLSPDANCCFQQFGCDPCRVAGAFMVHCAPLHIFDLPKLSATPPGSGRIHHSRQIEAGYLHQERQYHAARRAHHPGTA